MNEPEDRDLTDVTTRLEAERPVPRAAFRGDLRRRLVAMRPSRQTTRQRAWALVGAYAASGTALMAIAAIGLAGVGPLSA